MKTIWQAEREIDLSEFYYPARLCHDKSTVTVTSTHSLPYNGNIALEGIVGQGKSILLRYLASTELQDGRTIPVFLELRKIQDSASIMECVLAEMNGLGFDLDLSTSEALADGGFLSLFLDGFDEVKEARREGVVAAIEAFCKSFPRARVMVSTRPNAGISASAVFRVFKLASLEPTDVAPLISRLVHDQRVAAQIVKQVESRPNLQGLLTTPLMVALLAVRYKIDQSVPETEIAFFDQLFMLLLQRHDKLKAGYMRPRKSRLSDSSLFDAFCALCFLCRRREVVSASYIDLARLAAEALKATGHEPKQADEFLRDVIDVTCLVQEEGGDCRFIHKSVLEFHAACFVKAMPDDVATRFYTALLDPVKDTKGYWHPELLFLRSLDQYRYLRYFWIPRLAPIVEGSEGAFERLGIAYTGFKLAVEVDASGKKAKFWGLMSGSAVFTLQSELHPFAVLRGIDIERLRQTVTRKREPKWVYTGVLRHIGVDAILRDPELRTAAGITAEAVEDAMAILSQLLGQSREIVARIEGNRALVDLSL